MEERTQNVTETKENKETVYEINVTANRIKTQKDGIQYDFLAFSTTTKSGKLARLKFLKDMEEELPKEEGRYKFFINKRFINQDKSLKYLTYWVSRIEDYICIDRVDNKEDLPFNVAEDDELDF